MKLYLIRHAHSENITIWNGSDRADGRSPDPEIAGTGHQHAGIWEANWTFHNTSISRIDFINGSHTVVYLNCVDHLPTELITRLLLDKSGVKIPVLVIKYYPK